MNEVSLKPVIAELEDLFSKFNARFFADKLEKPVITVSPDHTRGAYGWCTGWKAWKAGEDDGHYEINLCAEYLNRPFEETCGTLLHEMVHLQNLQDGVQDTSRSGLYHNKKFRETAEAHGLTVEKGEKYGWHKTTLNPEALEFVQSLGKSGFSLVRPRITGPEGLEIRCENDWFNHNGRIKLTIANVDGGTPIIRYYHPDTLNRDYVAEQAEKEDEAKQARKEWVQTLGPELAHKLVDQYWG